MYMYKAHTDRNECQAGLPFPCDQQKTEKTNVSYICNVYSSLIKKERECGIVQECTMLEEEERDMLQ
jgi:hypothetical protein